MRCWNDVLRICQSQSKLYTNLIKVYKFWKINMKYIDVMSVFFFIYISICFIWFEKNAALLAIYSNHLVHSDPMLSTSTCIFVSATILDCFWTNLQASVLDFDATIFATRWCFLQCRFFQGDRKTADRRKNIFSRWWYPRFCDFQMFLWFLNILNIFDFFKAKWFALYLECKKFLV